jgi:hypothetical protein
MLVFLWEKAMPTDPNKDVLGLPAEAKLGGPKMPSAPPSTERLVG